MREGSSASDVHDRAGAEKARAGQLEQRAHDNGALHASLGVVVQPDLDAGFLAVCEKDVECVSGHGTSADHRRVGERAGPTPELNSCSDGGVTDRLEVLEDDVDGLDHHTLVAGRHAEARMDERCEGREGSGRTARREGRARRDSVSAE